MKGFVDKARENLVTACMCLEKGYFDAAANRSYYAAFQAAVAALGAKGIKKERLDHAWVQAQFNRYLIREEKKIPNKYKTYLQEMQIVRNLADYYSKSVGKRQAFRQYKQAEELMQIIDEMIF